MDDGCQSIPRPWLNAYSHTHIRSGVKVKEREVPGRKYLLHSLSFFPLIFGDFVAVRASRKKFIVCATNYCCRPGIGLGWAAGQIDRWLSFFLVFYFFSYGRLVREEDVSTTTTTATTTM